MVAELVAAGADVPRLGDQLRVRERRVLAQRVEEAAVRVEAGRFPSERDAEVEAEAVDVELVHPVAQRIHDQLDHARMRRVDRVAAAGVVDAVARVVGHQAVVARVVDAAKRQRRAALALLARVVVDHVEDHLDAGGVEPFDGIPHLVQFAAREVLRLGREERERVVAPEVAQLMLDEPTVLQERVDRQQLERGHADLDQVVDGRRVGQRRERAALVRADAFVLDRHAAHVRFVDHAVVHRRLRRLVAAPAEHVADHDRLRHRSRGVATIERQVGARRMQAITEQRVGPLHLPEEFLRVRIQQKLVRVEAMAPFRLIRSVDAIAVQLAGL